jgi:hypothetical protein
MQGLQIEAVYEQGTLKLPRALPFAEGKSAAPGGTEGAGNGWGSLAWTR